VIKSILLVWFSNTTRIFHRLDVFNRLRACLVVLLYKQLHLRSQMSHFFFPSALVWSTGVGPSEFVRSLDLPKSPGGRIGVDEWLRVPTAPDVFALGDCAGFLESTGKPVLPALAQVAEREGRYLAQVAKQNGGKAHCAGNAELGEPFVYKHLGSMASVGRYKALVNKALILTDIF
jgi:NADH dehydrogenase FAD-containing subunit